MELFKNTRAKLDDAASTVKNTAMLAVLALCVAVVSLLVTLTRTV